MAAAGHDAARRSPEPEHTLTADQTHDRWSRAIESVRRVAPGVEGPLPGDALAVTLHRVEVGD